jgi:hypothetical protein
MHAVRGVACLGWMEADGLVRQAATPWYDFIWNTGENGNAAQVGRGASEVIVRTLSARLPNLSSSSGMPWLAATEQSVRQRHHDDPC